jgi:hypothetical protein
MSTVLSKRQMVLAVLASYVVPNSALPQVPTPTAVLLLGFINLMKPLADGVTGLADAFKHSVKTGQEVSDMRKAAEARERLIAIKKQTAQLGMAQDIVVGKLGEYFAKHCNYVEDAENLTCQTPSDRPIDRYAEWQVVMNEVENVAETVNKLVELIKSEDSKFVAEKSYRALARALHERTKLFDQMREMQPPWTLEEMAYLSKVHVLYIDLVEQLNEIDDELAKYVKES